jgi:hypothetical protein
MKLLSLRSLSPVNLQLLGYAAIACILALAAGFGSGLWAGMEWEQGRAAQRDAKAYASEVAALNAAVISAQGAAAQISRDVQDAGIRLNTYSKGLSNDVERNRRTATAASGMLEAALASNRDLAAVVADADFMQAWNRANAGDSGSVAGADSAASAAGRRPDGGVPAIPATGTRPVDRGAEPKPPAERGDLPRLPRRQAPASRGGT